MHLHDWRSRIGPSLQLKKIITKPPRVRILFMIGSAHHNIFLINESRQLVNVPIRIIAFQSTPLNLDDFRSTGQPVQFFTDFSFCDSRVSIFG